MNIRRISSLEKPLQSKGSTIVMVGSFAPVHKGHFDAVRAAGNALRERDIELDQVVLTPNSHDYLHRKLVEESSPWTYDRRITEILSRDTPITDVPAYVDDISGLSVGLNEINDRVPHTLSRSLGVAAEQLYLITGSDQILSMEGHLADPSKRAICVLRPDGKLDTAHAQLALPWARRAIEEGRYIVTEREDMEVDVSSTAIRRSSV